VLIVVALLMVGLGMRGGPALAAVLGVAAFTCTSVSVAGEMMQDLKAGHILGCTPWRMQIGDIFGVTAAGVIMFLILSLLHLGDVKKMVGAEIDRLEASGVTTVVYKGENPARAGTTYTLDEIKQAGPEEQNDILGTRAGFGGEKLPAPQASLMAVVGRSIVERETEFILIIAGMLMGAAFIMMQVKSPMLIAVGMYLPIDTSFAIFVGGLMKGLFDRLAEKRGLDAGAKDKMTNIGVLLSSGLIAGEALLGILFAGLAFAEVKLFHMFQSPTYILSLVCMALIGVLLVRTPLGSGK
jgi:uncharacterized oligopeptide transporter (OPT) family protein